MGTRKFKRIAGAVIGKSCPICLNRLDYRSAAVMIPCTHAYCIVCIRRWSDVKRKCPLCNAAFDSWFSRISFSSRTFQKENLSAGIENKKLDSLPRPIHQFAEHRVTRRSREELNTFGSRTRPLPRRRSFDQIGASNSDAITRRIMRLRVSVYEKRLQAVPLSSKICLMQHMDNRDAKEKILQRIEPWIRRELQAILGDLDPSVIVHVATSLFLSKNTHRQQGDGDDFLLPFAALLA